MWIYREVIVEVDNVTFPAGQNHPVDIHVYVSERSAFNNPVADYEPNQRAELFRVSGTTRDITPTRNVDTLTTTALNKKLTLSLKDRIGFDPEERRSAFVIEALWYGKGTKTIYIPAHIPSPEFDEVEVIALTVQGGTPENPVLVVKYKNADGHEMFASSATLQELLAKAYGQGVFDEQPRSAP